MLKAKSYGLLFVLCMSATVPVAHAATHSLDLKYMKDRSGMYMKGVPAADRARAEFYKHSARANGEAGEVSLSKRDATKDNKVISAPITNVEYQLYTASIGVGDPPTYYDVIVDVGSANTFVGTGGKPYVKTNTSFPTSQPVNLTYGEGFFSGFEYLDQVTLAPGLVIRNQSIGDALESLDFDAVNGILGVGPVGLTKGTLADFLNTTIPTVMQNAVAQGCIESEVLGVAFRQANVGQNVSTNGKLNFGGVDESLYIGEITYTPITATFPASRYFGINVSSVTYGATPVIPGSYAGVVDTGTSLILMLDDWYDTYASSIPGSWFDANNTGLIVIPESSIPTMQPLTFHIGSTPFVLDVEAQLVPEWQNTAWGGVEGLRYGVIGPMGNFSDGGLDYIVGQKFLERFYAVFDTPNNRVGFAYTDHTFSLPY